MKSNRIGRPKGIHLENSARRRKQLVDAAVASIAEHGLSSTTLATVAKASGLSQGTAVFYFKTKDQLLAEAFQQRMEDYQQACKNAVEKAGDDPVDRIIAMSFASLDPKLMSRDNLALWNEFWPEASRSENLNAAFKQLESERQEMIATLFKEARGALSASVWSPEIAAQTVETMIEGIWARLHYSSEHFSFDQAIQMISFLLSTVFPTYREAITQKAKTQKSSVD